MEIAEQLHAASSSSKASSRQQECIEDGGIATETSASRSTAQSSRTFWRTVTLLCAASGLAGIGGSIQTASALAIPRQYGQAGEDASSSHLSTSFARSSRQQQGDKRMQQRRMNIIHSAKASDGNVSGINESAASQSPVTATEKVAKSFPTVSSSQKKGGRVAAVNVNSTTTTTTTSSDDQPTMPQHNASLTNPSPQYNETEGGHLNDTSAVMPQHNATLSSSAQYNATQVNDTSAVMPQHNATQTNSTAATLPQQNSTVTSTTVHNITEPKPINDTTPAVSSIAAPSSGRWGQTATYLPGAQVIMYIGGQVFNNSKPTLTNDVFALNVSALVNDDNSTAAATASPWMKLSSSGLPPHAYAAHATLSSDKSEQLWLFGGNTDNCSASSAWTWTAESGDHGLNGTWSSVNVTDGATSRRARAQAIRAPAGLLSGSNKSASAANETAFMLIGGRDASADCDVTTQKKRAIESLTADFWTVSANSVNRSSNATATSSASLKTLPLDIGNGNFSLVDYSTVMVPSANATSAKQGKTVYLGGLTSKSDYAPWNHFWSLDPWQSKWDKWTAQGDVPSGRRGHTSTLLSDGRIVVIGGLLEGGHFTNEVFVLDGRQSPANWTKATYAKNSTMEAPVKAYHSTVLVNDVLIVAFGAEHNPSSSSKARRAEARSQSQSESSIFYLDTASAGGWRWSDSIEDVLANRPNTALSRAGSKATSQQPVSADSSSSSTSSTASPRIDPNTASTVAPATPAASISSAATAAAKTATVTDSAAPEDTTATAAAPASSAAASSSSIPVDSDESSASQTSDSTAAAETSTTGSSDDSSEVGASPTTPSAATQPAATTNVGSTTSSSNNNNAGDGSSNSSNGSDNSNTDGNTGANSSSGGSGDGGDKSGSADTATKTGAIAGSLLGAAALVGAVGGLYAYKKRREAHQYGNQRADSVLHKMRIHRNAKAAATGRSPLPPVSALWFNNVRRREDDREALRDGEVTANAEFMVQRNKNNQHPPSFIMDANKFTLSDPPMNSAALRSSDMYRGETSRGGLSNEGGPHYSWQNGEEPISPTRSDDGSYLGVAPPTGAYARNGAAQMSSDSLNGGASTDGEASHRSYPFLSAMHYDKGSPVVGTPSTLGGSNGTPRMMPPTPGSVLLPASSGFYTPGFYVPTVETGAIASSPTIATRSSLRRISENEAEGRPRRPRLTAGSSPLLNEVSHPTTPGWQNVDLGANIASPFADPTEQDEVESVAAASNMTPSASAASMGSERNSREHLMGQQLAGIPFVDEDDAIVRSATAGGPFADAAAVPYPVNYRLSQLRVINRGENEEED
ncbi:unnamed protein product [Jaminaea pallidilutea]